MLTVAFIILKFTDSLTLGWWWIILSIILDSLATSSVSNRVKSAYNQGYEEGKGEPSEESNWTETLGEVDE
ncbi:MAG: hypothetical protein Greene07147_685 [Parcubacteria group bacterium Greene0714_7]|nr:MAG: hypothetical protein Greene07147_685 [Parcubacteria group bacterium Greene0714_7]